MYLAFFIRIYLLWASPWLFPVGRRTAICNHGDDSLFFFGGGAIGAAGIFGASPTAANDRSCVTHRTILHSMEGMQPINLFFFVLCVSCVLDQRLFYLWTVSILFIFFLDLLTLIDFERLQRKRYLNRLAIRLPLTSPTCREWPNVTLFLRDTNHILKKLYHVWRVS